MQIKGWWAATPSTIGYSPDLDPPPFDPDKARELMAAAGYRPLQILKERILASW